MSEIETTAKRGLEDHPAGDARYVYTPGNMRKYPTVSWHGLAADTQQITLRRGVKVEAVPDIQDGATLGLSRTW